MLLDLIKTTWKPLLLIALVSLTAVWAFNIQSLIVEKATINGIQMYVFNVRNYLQNVSNSWERSALNFEDILPPVQWQELGNNPFDEEFWTALLNNLAFIADWLYFPINFILWLWRWGAWLIRLMLGIVGWNIQQVNGQYYSELAKILNWVITNLMIPYINPN